MSKRLTPLVQRRMCELTDANYAVHVAVGKLLRAAARVKTLRAAAKRAADRLLKAQAEASAPKGTPTPNGKDGGT